MNKIISSAIAVSAITVSSILLSTLDVNILPSQAKPLLKFQEPFNVVRENNCDIDYPEYHNPNAPGDVTKLTMTISEMEIIPSLAICL
jgi:hypothetical protein